MNKAQKVFQQVTKTTQQTSTPPHDWEIFSRDMTIYLGLTLIWLRCIDILIVCMGDAQLLKDFIKDLNINDFEFKIHNELEQHIYNFFRCAVIH